MLGPFIIVQLCYHHAGGISVRTTTNCATLLAEPLPYLQLILSYVQNPSNRSHHVPRHVLGQSKLDKLIPPYLHDLSNTSFHRYALQSLVTFACCSPRPSGSHHVGNMIPLYQTPHSNHCWSLSRTPATWKMSLTSPP